MLWLTVTSTKSSTGDRLTRKDWLPKESNRGPQEKYLRSSLLSYSGQGGNEGKGRRRRTHAHGQAVGEQTDLLAVGQYSGGCASLLHAHTWLGSDLSLHGKPWVPGSIPRSLVFLEPARAGPRGCCPWSALTLAVLGGCSRAGMGGYKPCNFVTSSVVTLGLSGHCFPLSSIPRPIGWPL